MQAHRPSLLAAALALTLSACNAPTAPANTDGNVSADSTPAPATPMPAPMEPETPALPKIYGPDGHELAAWNRDEIPAASANQPANDIATRTGRDGILRAQTLLLRANFSTGEIDGKEGMNVAKAVRAFQKHRGLKASGELDEATWAELDKDTGPILISYALTQSDIDGPYKPTPERAEEKAKMERIVYENIHEMLGEKFNLKPELLKELNPGSDFAKAGTEIIVPWVRPAQEMPKKAKRIVVSKSEAALQLLDDDGKVFAQFPASTGSSQFPLPLGEWKITSLVHDPDYRYNPDILVNQPKDAKPATLPPGPNGPVGIVWMGINKEHYGIHGTPEPGHISRSQSSGCVRLTNWAAQAVTTAVEIGTPVTFKN